MNSNFTVEFIFLFKLKQFGEQDEKQRGQKTEAALQAGGSVAAVALSAGADLHVVDLPALVSQEADGRLDDPAVPRHVGRFVGLVVDDHLDAALALGKLASLESLEGFVLRPGADGTREDGAEAGSTAAMSRLAGVKVEVPGHLVAGLRLRVELPHDGGRGFDELGIGDLERPAGEAVDGQHGQDGGGQAHRGVVSWSRSW